MLSTPLEIPPGYLVHRIGDTWLVLDRVHAEELVRLRLADPVVRRTLFARAPRRGRGSAPSIAVARDLSIVLRRYRHGGLLGSLLRTLYWGPGRAFAELAVTVRAEAARAPVPHVLVLAAWPVFGPLWSALIGTQELAGVDLAEAARRADGRERERLRLAREVGAAIRLLHDAGVEHRDLQLRNVLVDERAGAIAVVDLDGARFVSEGSLAARRRARNLGRLVRSAWKLGVAGRDDRRALAALLAGYTRRDRELRRALRGWAAWERLKLAAHRAGYVLRGREGARAASPPRPA